MNINDDRDALKGLEIATRAHHERLCELHRVLGLEVGADMPYAGSTIDDVRNYLLSTESAGRIVWDGDSPWANATLVTTADIAAMLQPTVAPEHTDHPDTLVLRQIMKIVDPDGELDDLQGLLDEVTALVRMREVVRGLNGQ